MPTPVGPAPRDPNDPDFWDWGDDSPGGGLYDIDTLSDSERRQRRRRLVALAVVILMVAAVVIVTL